MELYRIFLVSIAHSFLAGHTRAEGDGEGGGEGVCVCAPDGRVPCTGRVSACTPFHHHQTAAAAAATTATWQDGIRLAKSSNCRPHANYFTNSLSDDMQRERVAGAARYNVRIGQTDRQLFVPALKDSRHGILVLQFAAAGSVSFKNRHYFLPTSGYSEELNTYY